MSADNLDRIEARWPCDYGSECTWPSKCDGCDPRRRDVLTLVEIARAAQELIDDREGSHLGDRRLALRAALARLNTKEGT